MTSTNCTKDEKEKIAVSIVVPVCNEEHNIDILYQEIMGSLRQLGQTCEVIFVDDGSTDNTFEYLKAIKRKELQEKDGVSQLRILRLSRNFGQTTAMQAGFDYAGGDVIISLDGDLQNDPSDIPKLLDRLNEGYDVVCGWRADRKDKLFSRILPSKVANWIIGRVTGVPIRDNGCSLKAYKGSVIKSIRFYSDMHRFIPAMTSMLGAKLAEIPVNHRARKYGASKYGLSRIWKVLFDIVTIKMLTHFRNRPASWFGTLSLIFFLFGLGFAITSIWYLFQGEQSVVYSGASFLFFLLFGDLVSWGLLAEFIVNIEREASPARRSLYVDGNTRSNEEHAISLP